MNVDSVALIINGQPQTIAEFTWHPLPRWSSDPIYSYHRIPGGLKGRVYSMGKDSPRNTLSGRAPRTTANEKVLSDMEGGLIDIVAGGTTVRAFCTKVADADNPAWLVFRASVIRI